MLKVRFKQDVEGDYDGKPYQVVFKKGELYEAEKLPDDHGDEGVLVKLPNGYRRRFWRKKGPTPHTYDFVEE
jgi:hypothetical protein